MKDTIETIKFIDNKLVLNGLREQYKFLADCTNCTHCEVISKDDCNYTIGNTTIPLKGIAGLCNKKTAKCCKVTYNSQYCRYFESKYTPEEIYKYYCDYALIPQLIDLNGFQVTRELFETLPLREKMALYQRFILNQSLEQVGLVLNITRERVRQIEAIAIRRLRHRERLAQIEQAKQESRKNNGFTPIEELNLSVRTYNCLKRAGIFSIEELLAIPHDEFEIRMMNIRNLGRKSFKELKAALKDKIDEKKELKEFVLADYEKKIGLDLKTLLSCMFEGFYEKKDGIIYFHNCSQLFIHYENGKANACLDGNLIEDYGVTWSKNKEDLE